MTRWFGNLKLRTKIKLQRVVNTCSKIAGISQLSLSSLVRKVASILADTSHPLPQQIHLTPSGQRHRAPRLRTSRALGFFIPNTVSAINHLL